MFQLKRNGICKSIVAMIMAVAMCFSLISMSVMAAEVMLQQLLRLQEVQEAMLRGLIRR